MRHLKLKDLLRAATSTKSTSTLEDEQEMRVDGEERRGERER